MVTSGRSLVLYWVVALKKLESLKPQRKLACQNPISVTLDKFTLPRVQNGTPPGTFRKKHSDFSSGTVIWQSTSQRLLIKLCYSSKPSLLSYLCHCFIILTALAVFKTLLGWVYMCVICFGNVTLFFAFPCNAKSFVIWCVLLFLLPYPDLWQTGESAILMFYSLIVKRYECDQYQTNFIGHTEKCFRKKLFLQLSFTMRAIHVSLFTVTSI